VKRFIFSNLYLNFWRKWYRNDSGGSAICAVAAMSEPFAALGGFS
jgi:hypothetical protein